MILAAASVHKYQRTQKALAVLRNKDCVCVCACVCAPHAVLEVQ